MSAFTRGTNSLPDEPQGWIHLDRYLATQERVLENASTFFIDDPTSVIPEFLFDGTLRVHGDLLCRGGLLLHVDKYFEIGEENRIRAFAIDTTASL